MKSRAGLGSVKMTAWLATVLCCWDWALADYDFPWLTADGAPPTFRINTSEYDFAHAIGRPGKSEEEAAEGPRLLSRSWQRLVVSRGSSITLNCSVADPGDVSVTWTRNKEVLTVDRYSCNNLELAVGNGYVTNGKDNSCNNPMANGTAAITLRGLPSPNPCRGNNVLPAG
nr:uncharacterized protein LOC113819845 [Penaeus vannamei]